MSLSVGFENGFSVFHKTYNGSISNIKMQEDMMRVMAQRGIRIIIMDRGFYSEANVKSLHQLDVEMIVGVKQSNGIKKIY